MSEQERVDLAVLIQGRTPGDAAAAILGSGWVSPAAVAGRDAEIERLRADLEAMTEYGRRMLKIKTRVHRERDEARAVLGAVAALADEVKRYYTDGNGHVPDGDGVPTLWLLDRFTAVLAPVSGAVEGAGGEACMCDGSQIDPHTKATHQANLRAASPVAGHEQEVWAEALREAADEISGHGLLKSGRTNDYWEGWDDSNAKAQEVVRALAARASGSSVPVQGGAE